MNVVGVPMKVRPQTGPVVLQTRLGLYLHPLMAYSTECLLQKAVECPIVLSLHRSLYRAGGMSLIQTHSSAMDACSAKVGSIHP